MIDRQNYDTFSATILKLLDKKVSLDRYFINDEKLLHKVVREDDKIFYILVVPQTLSKYLLHQVYDALRHNGSSRIYWYLKWMYYWKGLWKDVDTHVKQCINYRQQNMHPQHYAHRYLKVFACALHWQGLIVKFKPLTQGHQYALTVINMMTNYAWCLLVHTKADEVVHAYLVNIYCKFYGQHKTLLDNGSEFKNMLFTHVASTLWVKQVYSSPTILEAVGALIMYLIFWRHAYGSMSPELHGMM